MAGLAADAGTGVTVVFGTSAWTGELLSADWTAVARNAIETTHMGSVNAQNWGSRSFLASDLVDAGELAIVVHANTLQTSATQSPAIIEAVIETITLTWPKAVGDTTAATWAASGFVTNVDTTFPLDDVVTHSVTVKLTGSVTIVAAT